MLYINRALATANRVFRPLQVNNAPLLQALKRQLIVVTSSEFLENNRVRKQNQILPQPTQCIRSTR